MLDSTKTIKSLTEKLNKLTAKPDEMSDKDKVEAKELQSKILVYDL